MKSSRYVTFGASQAGVKCVAVASGRANIVVKNLDLGGAALHVMESTPSVPVARADVGGAVRYWIETRVDQVSTRVDRVSTRVD
jgi:hypothetical protein